LCILLSALQQTVLIAADYINRNEMGRIEVVASRGKVSALIVLGGGEWNSM